MTSKLLVKTTGRRSNLQTCCFFFDGQQVIISLLVDGAIKTSINKVIDFDRFFRTMYHSVDIHFVMNCAVCFQN